MRGSFIFYNFNFIPMKAWVISKVTERITRDTRPLEFVELDIPDLSERDILIKVHACGVCHTEIDEIEGRAKPSFLPIIPGHQVVGQVVETGKDVKRFKVGDRVGAGWIYWSCGKCEFCLRGLENLCESFTATGKDVHGGYAEYFKINQDFAFPIPENFTSEEAAPLFCAGAIGYRSLMLTKLQNGQNIGLVGFGASGHIVLKIIKSLYPDSKIFVFTRDLSQRELAKDLGADWSGDIEEQPPEKLNSAIDTTPVWRPPISVLKHLKPSGRLVINAIRKEDIDREALTLIDYPRDLWLEREIKSVANITRKDIEEFLSVASRFSIKPEIEIYDFNEVNRALQDIKNRNIKGAKVIKF